MKPVWWVYTAKEVSFFVNGVGVGVLSVVLDGIQAGKFVDVGQAVVGVSFFVGGLVAYAFLVRRQRQATSEIPVAQTNSPPLPLEPVQGKGPENEQGRVL